MPMPEVLAMNVDVRGPIGFTRKVHFMPTNNRLRHIPERIYIVHVIEHVVGLRSGRRGTICKRLPSGSSKQEEKKSFAPKVRTAFKSATKPMFATRVCP